MSTETTEVPEVPETTSVDAEELKWARQTADGLAQLWEALYRWRGIVTPHGEAGYHVNSTVRAITKALDSVSEAQEHLSAEIVSIQKDLGRSVE